jgi:pyruvate dehydrogenase E2 component (dihydrolipoamide acetyltransferase)
VEAAASGGGAAATSPVFSGTPAEDVVVPVTMMRKTIAKRLLAGKNDAPHFYLSRSADMTQMNSWRKKLNDELKKDDSLPKVSVNDLIIFACGKALRLHPKINSSWQGDHILQFGGVHVCMAVALPEGLITPVIRNADQIGVRSVAVQTKDLGRRAKSGDLKPDEYAGGTFTVSNLGMLGIEDFTGIINPPQSCILAVGATIKVPWVDASDNVVAQPRMKMTMSCDHRVVDGALGAMFLQTLVGFLEDPLKMLV